MDTKENLGGRLTNSIDTFIGIAGPNHGVMLKVSKLIFHFLYSFIYFITLFISLITLTLFIIHFIISFISLILKFISNSFHIHFINSLITLFISLIFKVLITTCLTVFVIKLTMCFVDSLVLLVYLRVCSLYCLFVIELTVYSQAYVHWKVPSYRLVVNIFLIKSKIKKK